MQDTAKMRHKIRTREEKRLKSEARAYATVSSMQCMACGQEGHMKSSCPWKDAICKRCGRTGHLAEACWRVTTAKGEKLLMGTSAVPKSMASPAPSPRPSRTPSQTSPGRVVSSRQSALIHTAEFRSAVLEKAAQIVAEQVMQK